MPVPDVRPIDPSYLLDEIHRYEAIRDAALVTLQVQDVELEEETARRILHRVDQGQSVAAAERAVVPELADVRRRQKEAVTTVTRCTNLISHYRFLLEHLPAG